MNLKNEYDEKDGGLLFSIFISVMMVAAFLLQFILASFGSFGETEAGTWIAQSFLYIVLLVAVIVYHKLRKINPIKALGLSKKFSVVDIIMSVVLGAGMLFAFLIFTFFWSYFLQEIGYIDKGGFPAINSAGTFILAIIVMCVLPAVTEETVFRGAVLKGYSKVFSTAAAVFLSALFFLLMHMNPLQVVNPILTGIVMAVLVHKTKTIKVSLIAHFTNNFIIILIGFIESFSPAAGQVSEVLVLDKETITAYLIYFVIGVVLLTGALVYFFMTRKGGRLETVQEIKTDYSAIKEIKCEFCGIPNSIENSRCENCNAIVPAFKGSTSNAGEIKTEIVMADSSIKRRRKTAILFALFGIIVTVLEIILGIFL